MKAITVGQPWASLIALGEKRIEVRDWKTPYRGPIAIHAGNTWTERQLALTRDDPFKSVLHAARHLRAAHLSRGVILATAELWDVRQIIGRNDSIPEQFGAKYERSFGDYRDGRWAWILRNVCCLDRFVPAKGEMGVWTWTPGQASSRATA